MAKFFTAVPRRANTVGVILLRSKTGRMLGTGITFDVSTVKKSVQGE